MDITNSFRIAVRAVKGANILENDRNVSRANAKSVHPNQFEQKAFEIRDHITQLRSFLLKHQREYNDRFGHHQNSSVLASGMTDAQRDQIDLEAQEYMSTCGALISKLKTQMTKESGPGVRRQQVEHRQGVVSVLSRYLKDVCTIYSRQRAVRVKRILDKKRLARLVPDSAPLDFKTLKATQNSTVEHQSNNDGLTPEEKEMFEQENAQLLEELTTTVDEVRQLEGKVVEISKLQEFFTEKVLQQSSDIEHVHGVSVESTENVQEGNEQLREAIKNNASFRVWILFFLVVLSMTLLFLDWYS
eukprot:m.66825 g.66825  ORF g.66825 m.66825 type:complete len:302 (+) comp35409_c0_seq23:10-915(+)